MIIQYGKRHLFKTARTTSFTNLNMSALRISILLHGHYPSADCLWQRGPGKCVNHSNKFHPLVLLCQQGRHFVRNKPSVGISAKKIRSMALLLADQLNVMCSNLTYSNPVFTHCCWVSKAQCIEGYQFLVKCQYNIWFPSVMMYPKMGQACRVQTADRLAQLVERRTTVLEVSGSRPRPDHHIRV